MIFCPFESVLNLHDSHISILQTKSGHYDILYHKDFLEAATELSSLDDEELSRFKGISEQKSKNIISLSKCRHTFSLSFLKDQIS